MSEQQAPAAPAVPSVYAAIARVAASMASEGIGKDRQNEQQRYKFRGIDDVLNALAREYADNDLFVVPRYSNRVFREYEGKEGKRLANVVVEGAFKIVSAVDGSFVESGPFLGEAMDSADKATNKAMSAAYKYFAIQTFAIPTEGDNDADATTHEVKVPRAKQAEPPSARERGPAAEEVPEEVIVGAASKRLVGIKSVNELREYKDALRKDYAGTPAWGQLAAKILARLNELQAVSQ